MKDANGVLLKNGDTIITERGVRLAIVEENDILYMMNKGNNQKRELENLDVDYFIEEN